MKNSKMRKSIVPGNGLAVKVLGSKPHDIEYALRVWKRKIKDAGVIENVRERMEYEKPKTKRRREKNEAIRSARRNQDNY
jgi:ribosomal protein S21